MQLADAVFSQKVVRESSCEFEKNSFVFGSAKGKEQPFTINNFLFFTCLFFSLTHLTMPGKVFVYILMTVLVRQLLADKSMETLANQNSTEDSRKGKGLNSRGLS